jgi:drug/metabolite transporter (DMT)-like permease
MGITQNRNIAIALMVAHCFFISLGTVLLKIMQFSYNISQIMFCYNFLLCVILLLMTFIRNDFFKISCQNIRYHFLRSIFGFSGFALFFYSLSQAPINEVRAILSLDPLLTSLFAVFFFKESFNLAKFISFSVTFIGAIILLCPENMQFSVVAVTTLLSAISFGIFNNITKKITTGKTVDQIFYLAFFSLLYTTFPAIFQWTPIIRCNDIFLMIFLTLLFALGSVTMFYAFKKAELSLIMPVHSLGIIMTAIFGVLFFDEIISLRTVIGAIIITIGTLPLFLKNKCPRG